MDKVIVSTITRSFNKPNDELYDLLKVVPAQPVAVAPTKSTSCDFQPRNDKQYIPKKRIKHKVKTVRDIRNLFEKDVLCELPAELEKQQSYILRKIKGGSLRENKTMSIAKNMLRSDKPLTKSTFQMIMNINPESHAHSMQYVLWNGKSIRINGSKGGKNKFICKYDLGKNRNTLKNNSLFKKNTFYKKKGLLQNSLSIDFKPGPLACKKFLDNSYQKYHVGHIDVVNLPKPGLEIQPLYGSALDPTISNFLNKLRNENGVVTSKWAEFAVSVLGTSDGKKIYQKNKGSSVTFDLNYKNDQTKLLMRRDSESEDKNNIKETIEDSKSTDDQLQNNLNILPEVQVMMKGILDAVEISVNQDDMFKEDDEIREKCRTDQTVNNSKEKNKRRFCELGRLDVTVIRLNENDSGMEPLNACKNSYCALGCICNSLQSAVKLKGHCGRIDCMFICKCDFANLALADAVIDDCPELLPGLVNLNNEINCTLSKEEQKFHQTVIVSGDKSILLKSKKRNCKSSKKYEDYYSSMCTKPKLKIKPILTIIVPKLNCENIEPWCMVHNLYKCFCKGRFTESSVNEDSSNDINTKLCEQKEDYSCKIDRNGVEEKEKRKERVDHYQKRNYCRSRKTYGDYNDIYEVDYYGDTYSCARVKPYEGRKYTEHYYLFTNSKIKEMEVNDSQLRKKLNSLINNEKHIVEVNDSEVEEYAVDNLEMLKSIDRKDMKKSKVSQEMQKPKDKQDIQNATIPQAIPETPSAKISMIEESSAKKNLSNKPKLVAWLEASYQEYKRRIDMGVFKSTLEPPKKGKIALYQWDFILSRYSERKNLFLVSKEPPYRIFMAVNRNNPLYGRCINIDDIRFTDLNKYPVTVKNLRTKTSNVKDYFCILYGYSHCWEFIGSVTKVNDQKEDDSNNDALEKKSQESPNITTPNSVDDFTTEASDTISNSIQEISPIPDNAPKKSKWFIMTIENDFTEIQFYNRGFFVTFQSIIKAINVARTSGKTVRLTSQKCTDKINDGTQYGIYAIPNVKEYCVFIGPYEINEPLGVETINSALRRRKRTRGMWITTDKVDNFKVIDDPLSFMPAQETKFNDLITIETKNVDNDLTKASDNTNSEQVTQISENKSEKDIPKAVNPIKISKLNGFFCLGVNSVVNNFSVVDSSNNKQGKTIKAKALFIKPTSTNVAVKPIISSTACLIDASSKLSGSKTQPVTPSVLPTACPSNVKGSRVQNRPVAEVAPQIKIASVYSEVNPKQTIMPRKRKEGGMFVLKPEEINQRLVIDGNKSPKAGSSTHIEKEESEIAMDIEHFLDVSTACSPPENETFVISDDEEFTPNEEHTPKEIFIECTNVENLEALYGEIHETKGVRFQFPGFNISEYYSHDEVFSKINQVLSRRVYIPKDMILEWRIVNSLSEVKTKRLLRKESFGSNLIMTPKGIKKKCELQIKNYKNVKTYQNMAKNTPGTKVELDQDDDFTVRNFEKDSQSLEDESQELLLQVGTKKNDIMNAFVQASNTEREGYTSVLKDIEIMSNVED